MRCEISCEVVINTLYRNRWNWWRLSYSDYHLYISYELLIDRLLKSGRILDQNIDIFWLWYGMVRLCYTVAHSPFLFITQSVSALNLPFSCSSQFALFIQFSICFFHTVLNLPFSYSSQFALFIQFSICPFHTVLNLLFPYSSQCILFIQLSIFPFHTVLNMPFSYSSQFVLFIQFSIFPFRIVLNVSFPYSSQFALFILYSIGPFCTLHKFWYLYCAQSKR